MKNEKIVTMLSLSSLLIFSFFGCKAEETTSNDNQPVRKVVELNENNVWQYIDIQIKENAIKVGDKGSIFCEINGVLDYAFYEDVVIGFEVVYYTPNQTEEDYKSYTMFIKLNTAGDAVFETTYLGITNVTLRKWNGVNGELVNLLNYNRKIMVKSITGNIIYTM